MTDTTKSSKENKAHHEDSKGDSQKEPLRDMTQQDMTENEPESSPSEEDVKAHKTATGIKIERSRHKRFFSWIFAIFLILVALGIYAHQKGYLGGLQNLLGNEEKEMVAGQTTATAELPEQQSKILEDKDRTTENVQEYTSHQKTLDGAHQGRDEEQGVAEKDSDINAQLPQNLVSQSLSQEMAQSLKNLERHDALQKQIQEQLKILHGQLIVLNFERALLSGFPFEEELQLILPYLDEEEVQILSPMAKLGLPTRSQLLQELPTLLEDANLNHVQQQAQNIFERILLKLHEYIKIRPQEAKSVMNLPLEIQAARRGDFALAIDKLEQENLVNKAKVRFWLIHAKSYDQAYRILTKLKGSFFKAPANQTPLKQVLQHRDGNPIGSLVPPQSSGAQNPTKEGEALTSNATDEDGAS